MVNNKLASLVYYSPEYELFYMRTSKCASTTISDWLMKNARSSGCGTNKEWLYWMDWKRSFVVIRNPFDRVVSSYRYFIKKRELTSIMEREDYTFSEYVDKLITTFNVEPKFLEMRDGIFKKGGLIKKHRMNVLRIHTIQLTHPFYLADKFEDILRFENLQEDWSRLLSKYNIPNIKPLGDLNRSNSDIQYRDYYDDTTIDKVANFYKHDLKIFNYTF